jgi:hypothetical protein
MVLILLTLARSTKLPLSMILFMAFPLFEWQF